MEIDAEKLVELVKQREAIYNYTVKDSNNKQVVDKLWDEIAAELNTTVVECKTKWSVLRNSYTRVLRERRRDSYSSKNKKRKIWYLSDAMSFLDDFIKQQPIYMQLNDTHDIQKINENTIPLQFLGQDNYYQNSYQNDEDINRTDDLNFNQNFEQTKVSKNSKNKNELADKVDELVIELLQNKNNPDNSDDPDFIFFKSLIPDFKRLPARKQRKYKEYMLSTLNRFLEEEELEDIRRRQAQCNQCVSGTKSPSLNNLPANDNSSCSFRVFNI